MPQYGFKAVIFDLDGVITQTALTHSAAWKSMFDSYLKEREDKHGEPFREFTHEEDYLNYVDGKPRYEGVDSFLKSRKIELPWGDPSDSPEKETVCGIGNRKNIAFNETLKKEGVKVYDSTVDLIRSLIDIGIKIGVASSSKNCQPVLQAAGIEEFFETRVDGVVSAELGLKGKPEPDIFTTAAENLGVQPDQAIVVEDAVSGVSAGRKGNFGLVLGVARENNGEELLKNGADLVVTDLGEINFDGLVDWFRNGLHQDQWSISYLDYDPGKEKSRETLLAVGNGYFGTRGAMEESKPGDINYPGTYMAGVYNRLVSEVGGREVENEDLVNGINWIHLRFRIDDSDWIDINNCEIIEINRVLHFNNGVLYRKMIVRDNEERLTRVDSRRIASMSNPHLAAIEYIVTPLNYSGKITLESGLTGDHINDGVERYRQLNQDHLVPVVEGNKDDIQFLEVKTTQSDIHLTAAARINILHNEEKADVTLVAGHSKGRSIMQVSLDTPQDHSLTLCKIVSLYHSEDKKAEDRLQASFDEIRKPVTFNDILKDSEKQWEKIWDRINIKIDGDRLAQKLIRLHLYHLMVTCSPHNANIDFGIPARGLHGEAYRGHIFWDELFIMPLYNLQYKETARSVLMYRYRRLDEARKYAGEHGYQGAMFPWQSGSSGREETQVLHLNPVSGDWGPDYSSLQRHVSLAIAYNVWEYFSVTGDQGFMDDAGIEMFLEICRFWVSKCYKDEETGRYSIDKVMGPDEFHEKYPGAKDGGLKDNAYTNIMVAWMLGKAQEIIKNSDEDALDRVFSKIGMQSAEPESWDDIAQNLHLEISVEGIISQYEGYLDLKELDWDHYREKYGNIYRMDRILKAEGKSADEYKVSKQADTLMTFYNLEKEEVDDILSKMGYDMPGDYVEKNLRYYLGRTSHGSTLSRVVHAWLANMIGDKKLSWDLYMDALQSDFKDVQGGTTGEGIHAGVMAGTVWIALKAYAGLDLSGDIPAFSPNLPDHWRSVSFGFTFQDDEYECEIFHNKIRIRIESDEEREEIKMNDMIITVETNKLNEFKF